MSKNRHQDNFVKADGVIKEQVETEFLARESSNKWTFLQHVDEICLQVAEENGMSQEDYRRITTRRKGAKLPAVPNAPVPAPSGPTPLTTSGEIGWRSSAGGCNLERFGRLYISPRYTVEPPGSDIINGYNYIILG